MFEIIILELLNYIKYLLRLSLENLGFSFKRIGGHLFGTILHICWPY